MRPGVSSVRVRKVKGKKGVVREQYDLIVNIDLVMSSSRDYLSSPPGPQVSVS